MTWDWTKLLAENMNRMWQESIIENTPPPPTTTTTAKSEAEKPRSERRKIRFHQGEEKENTQICAVGPQCTYVCLPGCSRDILF
jgi:hypothetical protein